MGGLLGAGSGTGRAKGRGMTTKSEKTTGLEAAVLANLSAKWDAAVEQVAREEERDGGGWDPEDVFNLVERRALQTSRKIALVLGSNSHDVAAVARKLCSDDREIRYRDGMWVAWPKSTIAELERLRAQRKDLGSAMAAALERRAISNDGAGCVEVCRGVVRLHLTADEVERLLKVLNA